MKHQLIFSNWKRRSKPDREDQYRQYISWGMTPRMARKKTRILAAFSRAIGRQDRRAAWKWIHAHTRFDTTNVNGEWSVS